MRISASLAMLVLSLMMGCATVIDSTISEPILDNAEAARLDNLLMTKRLR